MERFDSCFHPHHACDPHPNEYHENIHYTPDQINALLGLIPYKADRAEVPKMETLNDVNYIGHVATSEALPDKMEQPSWALVGSVKETKPYFYYVEGFVPKGYRAGWNDLSGVLGTYDLTVDKVSIFDYNLLTEYNVSRNHTQDTRIFSHDWKEQRYFSAFPDYVEGKKYRPCDRVNMPGYTKTSFVAQRSTSEAPFVVKKSNVFTFEDAIALVPEEYRIPGMKVTFVSAYTNQAETWYFKGKSVLLWRDWESWQKIDFEAEKNNIHAEEVFGEKMETPDMLADRAIADENGNRILDTYLTRKSVRRHIEDTFNDMFINNPPTVMDGMITPEMLSESVKQMIEASGGGNINNYPDDEDISSVHGQLKLANKRYDPNNYSGKGRQYLRKNLIAGRNILTQSMMCWPNTIYIVQYDYELDDRTVIIPEGCILQFDGGNLNNGIIVGNNTNILSPISEIFTNMSLKGTWNVDISYPEWFGARGDGVTDDRKAIQNAIDLFPNILMLGNKVYRVSYTDGASIYYTVNFRLPPSITIMGNNTRLLRTEGSNRCFEGSCRRENIVFFTKNVQFGSTTVTVTDASGYAVGDKILIVGEDGTSEDKAEPLNYEFNYIAAINEKTITLKSPISFGILLSKCNTKGSTSSAINNGSISKVVDGEIKISGIEDITNTKNKTDGFITIKYQENVFIDNVKSLNQPVALLQYSNNITINNCRVVNKYSDGSYYHVGVVLWETNNVLVNNLEIIAQSNPIVGISVEGGIKKIIANNVKFISTNSDGNSVLCSVTEGADVTFNDVVFNILDSSKLLIATVLDTESNISSIKLHNVTLYNDKFKSFDTFFSTIGNRVAITGLITIQVPDNNSMGRFNSYNIGEEFVIPITIHYNKMSTATSDVLYNFNGLLLTKAEWYSEEDDIEIKGNLIGSKVQSIIIGKGKTGWNSKKLNVTLFDNKNCYISFTPKMTDTHAEVKLFIYARPFLNKSNTSMGNATIKTVNIRNYGDTQHRPIIDRCNIGTMYFDTTLGKPIWNKDNSQWVDSTGATV